MSNHNVLPYKYADYMLTEEFKLGINTLYEAADDNTVVILCAERHPSRCHRLIISNWLAAHDVKVNHISGRLFVLISRESSS